MQATHKKTEDNFELLRSYAREAAQQTLPIATTNSFGHTINAKASVKLEAVDFKAKLQAKEWERDLTRRATWSWEYVDKYAWQHPKRFELAIWYRNQFLCGLSIGRPTWSGNRLRLDFIEAAPTHTPLTGLITNITLLAAETYADSIGATQLRIMNPINEQVRNHYLSIDEGFQYEAKGDFCFKDLI